MLMQHGHGLSPLNQGRVILLKNLPGIGVNKQISAGVFSGAVSHHHFLLGNQKNTASPALYKESGSRPGPALTEKGQTGEIDRDTLRAQLDINCFGQPFDLSTDFCVCSTFFYLFNLALGITLFFTAASPVMFQLTDSVF